MIYKYIIKQNKSINQMISLLKAYVYLVISITKHKEKEAS